MTVPKLELRALRKEYDDGAVVAVEGLDLSLGAGETLAILGPSGCGKSTTLNMIVGIETPTSGDILIDGASVLDRPAGQRPVGLVFQDYAVFSHMNVAGNLAFGLKMRGLPRTEVARKVEEVADLLGLTEMLGTKAARLGGSELQRVAIGRTLATEPALLLLDEPLSNLELEMRAAMRRELRRLQAETGLTIVYVTHDQTEALSLAQRIAVMSDGKLRHMGPTREVWEQPAHTFVAGFIGEPPMSLLPGRIGPGAAFEGGPVRLPVPGLDAAPGAEVLLGLRPDAITLTAPGADAVPAAVHAVEPRGADTVLTLDVGGHPLAALAPSRGAPSEGDAVGLHLDPARVAVFDADTRRNLRSAAP